MHSFYIQTSSKVTQIHVVLYTYPSNYIFIYESQRCVKCYMYTQLKKMKGEKFEGAF